MNSTRLSALGAGLLFAVATAATPVPAAEKGADADSSMQHTGSHTAGHAGMATHGDLTLKHARVRATIGAAPNSAAYLTIATGGAADRLIAAASPVAARVEIHTTVTSDGTMSMTPVDGIDIRADAPAELMPGGYHIMLMRLTGPLTEGDHVPLTLTFENSGQVTVVAPVLKRVGGGHHKHGS